MIMINGNWEQVKDLSDVIRIVSENISREFAQEVEKICGEPSEELYAAYQKLENKCQKLENEKDELEHECNDYDSILENLDNLNEQIDKLEKYIDENADGTDYMRGMEKAFKMIER